MSDLGTPTNGDTNGGVPAHKDLAETLAKVREKGWNNPVPFRYETVGSGATPNDDRPSDQAWLGNAAVYEWDDDFGEVGPRNEKLEEMLYRGNNIMRVGNHLATYQCEVATSGAEGRVAPVREVRSHLILHIRLHELI